VCVSDCVCTVPESGGGGAEIGSESLLLSVPVLAPSFSLDEGPATAGPSTEGPAVAGPATVGLATAGIAYVTGCAYVVC